MIPIRVNQTKRNAIQNKSVKNTGNRTCQNHCQAILIRPKTVITDASALKEEPPEKGSYTIMRRVKGKVAYNSI